MKIKESVVSGQKSVAGRRFARSKNAQKARQRLECVCFSTAFRNPCPLMSISGWKSWCLGVFVVKTGSKNSNLLQPSPGFSNLLKHPPGGGGEGGGVCRTRGWQKTDQGKSSLAKPSQAQPSPAKHFPGKKRLFIFLWAPQIKPNQPGG
jgi:hypothetical protein